MFSRKTWKTQSSCSANNLFQKFNFFPSSQTSSFYRMWTIRSCRNEFIEPLANSRVRFRLLLSDHNSIHVNRRLPSSWYRTRASIKPGTWNIPEHPGTFWNIPEHGIIIIIMRKIGKIKFSTTKWNKIELVSAWKIKRKKKQNRTKQNKTKT